MWANVYVAEKLRELDRERLAHIKHAELQRLASRRPRSLAGWRERPDARFAAPVKRWSYGRRRQASARTWVWR
jgi:hypothetical protein